jgi:pyruvate/2-oxoglutarate dehydrogenase complex dihydrolipoamide acyltransferase (E2) component
MIQKENRSNGKYEVSDFPEERKMVLDIMEQGMKKHYITALIEIDVTIGKQKIRTYKSQYKKPLSFTGWILKCIGEAASRHKEVHAVKKGFKLYRFDDVDISITVEKVINGQNTPLPLIIRKTNEKTVHQITDEIIKAREESVEESTLLATQKEGKFKKIFPSLPKFIRKIVYWRFGRDPLYLKDFAGTVSLTSVGMFGNIRGWGIPIGVTNLMFTLGGIIKKPVIIENKIETREILHMTVMFDHDVVDGAPAARFISDLQNLIENGYGLEAINL